MGRLRSMPLQRYESSGNLDDGDTNSVFNIIYDGNATTDDLAPANRATIQNTESISTNKPVIIYKYEATCIWGGPSGVMFQYYGDDDDFNELYNWDMSSSTFTEGLKNKLFMGSMPSFESDDTPPYGHAPQFKVYKLKFKARKNPRKMRAKYGKWAVPPIVVSAQKKNTFGFSVTNLRTGDSSKSFDNQRYYMHIELKRWQTEF